MSFLRKQESRKTKGNTGFPLNTCGNDGYRTYAINYYNYDILGNLLSIDFGIKNLSNYPIKNIKLFFVYKNHNGEVISYSAKDIKETILPQLALQFGHDHRVKHFTIKTNKTNLLDIRTWREGEVEIRILDYQIDQRGKTLPSDLLFK